MDTSLRVFRPNDIKIKNTLGGNDKFNVFIGIVKDTGKLVVVKNVTIGEHKRELDVLKNLRHKNVIRLLGTIEQELSTSTGLVLEYAPNGSLYEFLHKKPRTHFDYLDWCKQAVSSVVYIHDKEISHRDIKSKNYLVFGAVIKLTDFGLSKFLKDGNSRNVRGTILWMSPEVLTEAEDVDYFKSDIYSLGVVLWELYHQRKPYQQVSILSVLQHVIHNKGHPEIDDSCDVRLRDVMLNCWNYQPDQRPNAEQILTSLDNVPETLVRSSSREKEKQIHREEDQTAFQHLLANLSKDYAGNKYRWLRMLLHDIIPSGDLEYSTTGLDLFNKLVDIGKISITDVTLLSDVAETTEQTSAKDRIAEYKRTVQCSETLGTKLTSYRRALFEALMNVGHDDLLKVIGFYTLKHHGFDNIWDVVFHLEQQELLIDTQEKCKRFADLLNKKTGRILLAASKTLLRDATCMPSLQQSEVTLQPVTASFLEPNAKITTETFVSSSAREKKKHLPVYRIYLSKTLVIVIAIVILIASVYVQLQTTTAPPKNWLAEAMKRMRENHLEKNKGGTVKVYDREFSFKSGHELWKYYSTATDVVTGTKAKAGGYQSMDGANQHAVENLIYKLMAKGLIKN
ncbi:uncharacterized protein [Antedon mediterranea]|uniref:uncharacterized protein n=1 Tax=Antedon mediterranea TaxID=105859 RepID=UPI003AF93813